MQISSKPSDFQFFVFDLGIMSVPYFVLGNSPPSDYLHPQKPQRNLWAFLPMFSLFTFIIWQIAVMLIGWFYCHSQNWSVELVKHMTIVINHEVFMKVCPLYV